MEETCSVQSAGTCSRYRTGISKPEQQRRSPCEKQGGEACHVLMWWCVEQIVKPKYYDACHLMARSRLSSRIIVMHVMSWCGPGRQAKSFRYKLCPGLIRYGACGC
eukprot:scaffold187480_cov18-Tisochrysis_lutea.AAC.2